MPMSKIDGVGIFQPKTRWEMFSFTFAMMNELLEAVESDSLAHLSDP